MAALLFFEPFFQRFHQLVEATKRLDQWFDVTGADVPDINKAQAELYGWHWFFRHSKQGKKWRKTYESYLQTLRDTGDPAAAEAVWEGTDFGAMRDAFKALSSGNAQLESHQEICCLLGVFERQ